MPRKDPMRDAAEWFVRLSRTTVSVEALREFREWQRKPENAEAYRAVETAWEAAASLKDDQAMLAAAALALGRARTGAP